MRTTFTSILTAAALTVGIGACKKDRDDTPGVAQKPIEAADKAAEDIRDTDLPSGEKAADELKEANKEVGEARADLNEETREANEEVGKAFAGLRDELRNLSAKG